MELHYLWIPGAMMFIVALGLMSMKDSVKRGIKISITAVGYCICVAFIIIIFKPEDPHAKRMRDLEYKERSKEVIDQLQTEVLLKKMEADAKHNKTISDSW